MKDSKFFGVTLSIALFFLGGEASKAAATLYLNLDHDAPGIQTTPTLSPGIAFNFEAVFSGDGATQFDTFALDVVYDAPQVTLHSPFAGPVVDGAPLMALDHAANTVHSGDALTQDNMPIPLSFEGGLVGVSSVGGPFPLLGQDEVIVVLSVWFSAISMETEHLM
jgi:hypothetical protein